MQSRLGQPVMQEKRRQCPEELCWSCLMQPSLPSMFRYGRLAHLPDYSAYNQDGCYSHSASHGSALVGLERGHQLDVDIAVKELDAGKGFHHVSLT